MSLLRAKLAELLPVWRDHIARLVREHGEHVIGQVTAGQILGGLRGARTLVCDTSSVDPQTGLSLRGIPVKELAGRDGHDMFWLLLTAELPSQDEHTWLEQDLLDRLPRPPDVERMDLLLEGLPPDCPPTAQYAALLMAMQSGSRFAAAYGKVDRLELWAYALEDALSLRGVAAVAATRVLIRWRHNHPHIPGGHDQWFQRVGFLENRTDAEVSLGESLSPLYLVVHSDHENGNASAFAFTVAASALADPYLALVASLNALAGPLHGRASETCLLFVRELLRELGEDATADQVRAACWARLRAKQVIPGFGHAVLRCPDPRFQMLKDWGDAHCADDPVYRMACLLYDTAPDVLREHGAASNPYPNVDAISGVLLWCCGQRYPEFYTINFSLAQMNGLLANYVLARGLGLPIMRPRSVTLAELRGLCGVAA